MRRPLSRALPLVLLLASSLLAGCEMLGIESPEKLAASREAEGKAIGGACRHAGRAIEDCYTLNKKAEKSAVYAGWLEMNDYMRENKLDVIAPQIPQQPPPTQVAAVPDKAEEAEADNPTPAKKAKN